MLTVANLLLVHPRKLLRSALLDRIWLQTIHIVRCYHLLTVLLASCRRLPSLVCILYRAFSPHECVQVELVWRCLAAIVTRLLLNIRAFRLGRS